MTIGRHRHAVENNVRVVVVNRVVTRDTVVGAARTAVRMIVELTDGVVLAVMVVTPTVVVNPTTRTNSRRRTDRRTVLGSRPEVAVMTVGTQATRAARETVTVVQAEVVAVMVVNRQVQITHRPPVVVVPDVVVTSTGLNRTSTMAVSYTHLTLPTILRV